MPHQVTKATARGSKGDLAKIADALRKIKTTPPGGVNIVAIGGGEGVIGTGAGKQEIGVISMILEPDDGDTSKEIVKTLKELILDSGNKLEHVEVFPNIHIQIEDKPGELKKALDAVKGINIRSVISMGTMWGTANVGLGFAKGDAAGAKANLKAKGIKIVEHPH